VAAGRAKLHELKSSFLQINRRSLHAIGGQVEAILSGLISIEEICVDMKFSQACRMQLASSKASYFLPALSIIKDVFVLKFPFPGEYSRISVGGTD
jgi:hypothetical protein